VDDKHVTHAGFQASPPQNIRKLYSTLDFRRWRSQRVWQRKNKSTRRVLLPKKRPTAQRTGCSLQEVWFTGSPFRCFALVVNWLVSVGRQSLFSDLVLDTPTALAQTVQPYCSVFCSLVTLVLLTETCCKQQASESYSVLSYETNQHNRFRVGVLVPLWFTTTGTGLGCFNNVWTKTFVRAQYELWQAQTLLCKTSPARHGYLPKLRNRF
jgi:hypothetical protein